MTAPRKRKPKKPRIGRPPSADPTRPITVRPSASQIERWTAISNREGVKLRAWMLKACDSAAARGSAR